MPPVTRRAFLQLSGLTAGAAVAVRFLPTIAAARACVPVAGLAVPMMVPFLVGDDCSPPPATAMPTGTPTVTVTVTTHYTSTPTPTAPTAPPTATPTGTPWRIWVPLAFPELKGR
jgi:hypothetical protein